MRYEVRADAGQSPDPKPIRQHRPVRAGELLLTAARIETEAEEGAMRRDPLTTATRKRATEIAERARQQAPGYLSEVGAGGELVPASILGENRFCPQLHNTVTSPDYVTVDASRDRLELAQQAGALETGLDLADTVGAQNSLERMLAHQMAAVHRCAMRMTAQVNRNMDHLEGILPDRYTMDRIQTLNTENCRMAATAMRMMATFQQGATTLQRLRTGGSQQVTVQHQYVTKVEEGGQAVVAGQVRTGGGGRKRKGGGDRK